MTVICYHACMTKCGRRHACLCGMSGYEPLIDFVPVEEGIEVGADDYVSVSLLAVGKNN